MATKALVNSRGFTNIWDAIRSHYHRILDLYYEQGDREAALKDSILMEGLLKGAPLCEQSIFGEECWSVIHEVRGELSKAIRHRENEVRLIEELWRTVSSANRDIIFRAYGPSDLSDRLDLLANLYHENGDLDRAIDTLERSAKLCLEHRIEFEGEEMLKQYRREKRPRPKKTRSG
jgi:hypothetical protein